MFVIIGCIGVTICVIVGLVGPGGDATILMQPFEFIVIAGSSAFTILTGNPTYVLKGLVPALKDAVKGSGIDGDTFKDLLGLMACIFDVMRREGVLGIEGDLDSSSTVS